MSVECWARARAAFCIGIKSGEVKDEGNVLFGLKGKVYIILVAAILCVIPIVEFNFSASAPADIPAAVCGELKLILACCHITVCDLIYIAFDFRHFVNIGAGFPRFAVEEAAALTAVTGCHDLFDVKLKFFNALARNRDFLGIVIKGDGYGGALYTGDSEFVIGTILSVAYKPFVILANLELIFAFCYIFNGNGIGAVFVIGHIVIGRPIVERPHYRPCLTCRRADADSYRC